jgi:hypothetical protein
LNFLADIGTGIGTDIGTDLLSKKNFNDFRET